jgi:hypothetical protein
VRPCAAGRLRERDAMDINKDGKVTVEERNAWGKANKQPVK